MLRSQCLPARSTSLQIETSGSAPPDAFGPFRVLHQIGAGALGPVFRAYNPDQDRLVVVKLFRLDLPPERVHRFSAELERLVAAELTHPVIAAPLATGIVDVSAYLAQDFVAAESLDKTMRDHGQAPADAVLRVVTQLAGALDFAAAAGVTHGALHPRDVLVSADETRLTGLGIAAALEAAGARAPVRRPYSAPERASGEPWARAADVFSLAAVAHEMLWGRRVTGIGTEAAESLTPIEASDLSLLQQAFARGLAADPLERFSTALAFAEALKNALTSSVHDAALTAAAEAEVPARARRRRSKVPKLPLDDVDTRLTLQDEPPRIDDLDLRRAEAERYEDVEIAAHEAPATFDDVPLVAQPIEHVEAPIEETRFVEPAAIEPPVAEPPYVEPPIAAAHVEKPRFAAEPLAPAYPPEMELRPAETPRVDPVDIRPAAPVPLAARSQGDDVTVLERSRSAVWPLMLAVVVGVAMGFAAGYGVGSREKQSSALATNEVATTADNTAGTRDFTEGAVPQQTPRESAPADRASVPAPPPPVVPQREPRAPERPAAVARETPPANTGRAAQARVPAPGRLLVRSTPAGARVIVDGRDAGVTPATVRDLTRGPHDVRVVHDGYVADERRVAITEARPSQSILVELDRARAATASTAARGDEAADAQPSGGRYTGLLIIDSRPTGADVFLDGKRIGQTPLALNTDAGEHAIRLERDGYKRWTASTRVVASERNRVTAALER